jgi:hypothetical protein
VAFDDALDVARPMPVPETRFAMQPRKTPNRWEAESIESTPLSRTTSSTRLPDASRANTRPTARPASGEFQRIAELVLEHLTQHRQIAQHCRQEPISKQARGNSSRLSASGTGSWRSDRPANHAAGADTGEFEHVVDQCIIRSTLRRRRFM